MKHLVMTSLLLSLILTGWAQLKVTHSGKSKEITPYGAKLAIVVLSNGQYVFDYTNGLKGGTDFRSIVFKNKKDAKDFVDEISKAFKLNEGENNSIDYSIYKIDLAPNPTTKGEVFMVVKEKDKSESVLDITKEMYDQVNIL